MSMLDTVHHAGQEWLTKSTIWQSGGMQGDLEVRDGRLWLLPWDTDDGGKAIDLPPRDFEWHGILELFRNVPKHEGDERHRSEHKRLIFVEGQLLSETAATQDSENDCGWQSDYRPTDPAQRSAWQLHTIRGMVAAILAKSESLPTSSLASIKEIETSVPKALQHLEDRSLPS